MIDLAHALQRGGLGMGLGAQLFRLRRGGLWLYGTLFPERASYLLERIFLTPMANGKAQSYFWPEPDRALTLDHNGQPLACFSWGEGPTVVLLHGWGGTARQFGAFVAPLVEAGFRAVAFDAPAHGESGGRQTNFFDYVAALHRVAEQFGPLHAVVAHSFGAPTSAWAVSRGLAVNKLVLVAPPVNMAAFATFVSGFLGFPTAVRDHMARRFETRHGVHWPDLSTDRTAAMIDAPIMVVHDEGDRQVRWQAGESVAKAAKNGTFLKTTGLGHSRILADEDIVRRVTAFIAAET